MDAANYRKEMFLSEEKTLMSVMNNVLINRLFKKKPESPTIKFRLIDGREIEKQFANIRNIVFEVTDSCNLKCAYCGYGDLYGDKIKGLIMISQ